MERFEVINERLLDQFGRFEDGRPNWRVVWSTGLTEMALTEYTREGFILPQPEVQERLKYPFDQDRFILEHLIPVPRTNIKDLTTKTSYEPLWTFQDNNGNPTAPDWDMIEFLINKVQINMLAAGKRPIEKAPYGMGNTAEEIKFRAEQLMEKLFGNDDKIGDALAMD